MNVDWVVVSLDFREGALCGLLRLEIVLRSARNTYLICTEFDSGLWHHLDDIETVT